MDGERLPRDRFQIISRLGEGAFGVVYEARDRARGERIAVKLLHRVGADALLRFKNEFRALRSLRHPNLVRLDELIEHDGRWYITMELVRGSDFFSYVRRGTLRRRGDRDSADLKTQAGFDEERLRAALTQLCDGLHALHRGGKVHRDIKPSNVRVTHDGRLVLLDFGFVVDQQDELSTAPSMVGTAAYMSPEQAASTLVGPASDWYSVGVLLYEALTGHRPFTGSPLQIMLDKQRRVPPAPSSVARGVLEDLDALCVALLKVNPAERPSSEEVLNRLGARAAGTRPLMRAPFVGRERELSRLLDAVRDVRSGQPACFYVYGDPGSGKTRVLGELLNRIRAEYPDALVLRGRCHESETVPYKAFDGIIDGLSRHLRQVGPEVARRLLPEKSHALGEVFPVLARIEGLSEAKLEDTAREAWVQRNEVFASIYELFRRLGASTDVILLIDDLHFADAESVQLLERLLSGPTRPSVVIVVAGRPPEQCPLPVRRVIEQMQAEASSAMIELRGLSSEDAEGLAHDLLRQRVASLEHEPERARDLSRGIAQEAGGQPFLIELLVRQGSADRFAQGEVPTLEGTLRGAVDALLGDERLALELLAVTGGPIRLRVLAGAVDVTVSHMTDLAARLTAQGLAAEDGSGEEVALSVVQDRIREAVLVPLSPRDLADRHHRLARALLASGAHDAEALAVHLGESGDRENAAHYALLAAGAAYDALAFERSARLFRLAITLSTEDKDERRKRRLYARLGDALAGAGRSEEAAEAYRAAVRAAPSIEGVELSTRVAQHLLQAGRVSEGLDEVRALLRKRGHRFPLGRLGALTSLAYSRTRLALRGLTFEERGATWIAPERLAEVDLLWSVSCSLAMADIVRAADIQTRHLVAALDAGEPYRVARALAIEGWLRQSAAPLPTPEIGNIFSRARLLAGSGGHPHAQAVVLLAEGAAASSVCRFEEAVSRCEEAERLLRERCRAVIWEIDTAQYIANLSRLFMGRFDELCRLAPQQLSEARDRGDRYAETLLRLSMGFWPALFSGDTEGVVQDLKDAAQSWQVAGFTTQAFVKCVSLAHVYLFAKPAQAYDLLLPEFAQLERATIARVPVLRVMIWVLTAQAALASVRAGHDRSRLKQVRKMAALLAKEQLPLARPYAALLRGALAEQEGDRAAAISELHEAHAGFLALDMGLFAAAASYREGQLLGGAQGNLLVERARTWATKLNVAAPEQLLAMAAPGYKD